LLGAWSQGLRTLHGFYSHGFPNLFHLGTLQNANSVNFVHILQEQAVHIAAVIAKGREAGARLIEPTAEAEAEWGQTIRDTALENSAFQAECTPGYYNGEGAGAVGSPAYGPGPVAFHRLLRKWRDEDIEEVLSAHNEKSEGNQECTKG
jgi:hypothetical protein